MPKRKVGAKGAKTKVYDRKIYDQGHSKVIAVTQILPDDWRIVRIEKIRQNGRAITIKFTKLLNSSWSPANPEGAKGGHGSSAHKSLETSRSES